jgi:sigma-E factor negative regulatory protein RseB
MHRRARLALLGALAVVSPAWAQDAAGWMARMGEALTGLDYQGDLVYAYAGQIETLRVYHAAGPDGGRERLVSVSGAPREIVRAGGQVLFSGSAAQPSSYGEAGATPRLLGLLPGASPDNLQAHYAFVLGGTERVAALEAQVLDIRPRDAYRYGFRLWLERDTGMLLKSMRFGADGRPVEQLMFTRIELRMRPAEADLAASAAASSSTPMQLPQAETGRTPSWRAVDPPPGFVLALQQPAPQGSSEHLIYSDGIASVSVYVEALTPEVPAFSGPASRGAVSLYGRVLDGHQITVLGDVPAPTVERFAQGVMPAAGG